MVERRNSLRAKTSLVIELYEVGQKTILGVGKLLNVSEAGLGVETTVVLVSGVRVVARFVLKNQPLLSLRAFTIWSRTAGKVRRYGLRFESMDAEMRTQLKKFVWDYYAGDS